MTKADLIRLRDEMGDDEVRQALRWAIRRIENLESDLREVDTMAKSIRRIVDTKGRD
jgi:hypothetical protein